jgi:competence protein ComEA
MAGTPAKEVEGKDKTFSHSRARGARRSVSARIPERARLDDRGRDRRSGRASGRTLFANLIQRIGEIEVKNAFLFSSLLSLVGLVGLTAPSLAGQSKEKPSSASELEVDINQAGVAELSKLPGVGEQVAKRIIAYREENGPFEKAEELMNVRGIGEKSFLKLQPHVTLGSDKEKRKK